MRAKAATSCIVSPNAEAAAEAAPQGLRRPEALADAFLQRELEER